MISAAPRSKGAALTALIAVQVVCAVFFLGDVIGDLAGPERDTLGLPYLGFELVAALTLIAGIGVEVRYLTGLLRRQSRDARALGIASGALHQLIESWFVDWGLTASETDVAMFTIKGLSIAEIAALRGSAEGTVKAHLNAIYRKAGVAGRVQLLAMIVEELMGRPLIDPAAAPPPRAIRTGTGELRRL